MPHREPMLGLRTYDVYRVHCVPYSEAAGLVVPQAGRDVQAHP